ncbi:MAG: PEGA domain-containing protein [Bdellovibrionota bacterium]
MIWLLPMLSYADDAKTFGKPKILVDHVKVLDAIQDRYPQIQRAAFESFYQANQVTVVPPHEIQAFIQKHVVPAEVEQKDEVYLVKAKKLLEDGVQAYQYLEFDQAQQLLAESRDEWIRNLSHLRSNRDLLKSHLYLAMSLLALFKQSPTKIAYEELAHKELEKAVYLDTNLTLSTRTYSPEVVEAFEKVKQRVLQKPRVTVKISSNISSANIYINGKLEGKVPSTLRLIPGTYYVLVESPKSPLTPWTKLVELNKPVENLQANIQPLINISKEQHLFRIREGADQQSQDVSFIQNRGRALGADMVFLSNIEKVEGYRILGQLFDVRTGEFSQVAFIHMGNSLADLPGSNADLAAALLTQIRTDGYLVNSGKQNMLAADPNVSALGQARQENQGIQQAQAAKTKLYKKWWFWAGIVAIGAGGYYGITSLQTGNGDIKINNAGNF